MPIKASQLNPELRAIYRFVPNLPTGRLWRIRAIRRLLRAATQPKRPKGMTFEKIDFGPGAGVRVFTPASGGSGAALLFLHGGGMVIGAASQEDARLIQIADELDIVTVSVEYRLAPENPYPAPLDDCLQAWRWLQDNAKARGIDPERIAVGGQSAGGGLAAGLALRIHDELQVQPIAQLLFCPMLDDRTAADRTRDAENNFLWNNRSNLTGWTAYLGDAPGGPEVPAYAAPSRRRDLSGLPAAWIGTGDIELFFTEDRSYAEGLSAAGVDCTLVVVPGAPHAFESVAISAPIAKKYSADALAWLKQQLTITGNN
ncbi:alpha/beta hydrolase [Cryobacterium glucosi]|uniref:Alpha/beta hydrolase n=2 Tax=Cryobacterium glucosi TaxID=1259175 RepID=A0ABY2III9_9MICO|nr:alpha/beta hydrolase [Cryobacterium glucosi]